jgi:hypothetical protein
LIATSSDNGGISSNLLLLCPLEKARLNDLEMTSKNPPFMVYKSKHVKSMAAEK